MHFERDKGRKQVSAINTQGGMTTNRLLFKCNIMQCFAIVNKLCDSYNFTRAEGNDDVRFVRWKRFEVFSAIDSPETFGKNFNVQTLAFSFERGFVENFHFHS